MELESNKQECDLFLEALHDEPFNPLNRLVFADWLEGIGDPRAELVRLMAAPQKTPDSDTGARSRELIKRFYPELPEPDTENTLIEDGLAVLNWGDWIGGFATAVSVGSISSLMKHKALLSSQTQLRSLMILSCDFEELAELGSFVVDNDIAWLDLRFCRFETRHFDFLLESDRFCQTQRISLPSGKLEKNHLEGFLDVRRFPDLKRMQISTHHYSKATRRNFGKRVISRRKQIFPRPVMSLPWSNAQIRLARWEQARRVVSGRHENEPGLLQRIWRQLTRQP